MTKEGQSIHVKLACFLFVLGSLLAGVNSAEASYVTLTTSSTEGGSVTLPGEGVFSYPTGTVVAVEATVDMGYEFVRWTGTAVTYGQVADPCSPETMVTLPQSKTLMAHFRLAPLPDVTLTTSSMEGGSVTLPGEGTFSYPSGSQVSVVATADTCYEFVRWSGTAVTYGQVADANSPDTVVTLTHSKTLMAHFKYVCSSDVIRVATKPVLPQDLSCTSAILQGYISSDGGDPDCWAQFRYFKKTEGAAFSRYTLEQEISTANGSVNFSQLLEGLEPGCAYMYQAVAGNSTGFDVGQYMEFTTPECGCSQKVLLTVLAYPVGQVLTPGVGMHLYDTGTVVSIKAVAYEGYQFLRWEGSAVDANRVTDPSAAQTTVLVDSNYTVRACFVCLSDVTPKVIYVDDNAAINCIQDGSRANPYSLVQVGIHVASQGDTVVVLPGMYFENLNFKGKSIRVQSLAVAEPNDPDAPGSIERTVLHGHDAGSVVVFECGEDENAQLSGFTLTGGRARSGGAILCYQSSPTISDCIMAGNRGTRSGGAVDCVNSQAMFINCIIADNYAPCQGGGVVSEDSQLTFLSSIIWGNQIGQIDVLAGPDPIVMNSNVQGKIWPGSGNLSEDPEFSSPGMWVDPQNPQVPVEPSSPNAIWIHGEDSSM